MTPTQLRPGFVDRLRLAARVFRSGLPWEQRRAALAQAERGSKANPLRFPSWLNGRPEWAVTNLEAYIREGYNANALIYSAVDYKCRAALAAPLRAYQGDPDRPQLVSPADPLAKLLARPNPEQSSAEFHQLNTAFYNLAGEAFIFLDRPRNGGLPVAMRPMRPDRIRIIPQNGGIKGFLYLPPEAGIEEAVPILPRDMIHVKKPNPGDPLEGLGHGLSPLSAAAQSADVDNDITRFLKIFFQQGTMASTLLKFDAQLSEADIAQVRDRWKSVYGGYENWGEIAVLGGGGDVKRLGMTFNEMGFETLDERNESRILGPLGVPPILVGSRMGLARSTYSNYESARKAFWQDTFVPELQLFEVEYQYFLSEDGSDRFAAYDMSQVPALQDQTLPLANAARVLWSMGMPLNQAMETVGLDTEPIQGGDISYLPTSVTPANQVGQPSVAGVQPPLRLPPGANADDANAAITGNASMANNASAEGDTRQQANPAKARVAEVRRGGPFSPALSRRQLIRLR